MAVIIPMVLAVQAHASRNFQGKMQHGGVRRLRLIHTAALAIAAP